jgi:hypothetical protein
MDDFYTMGAIILLLLIILFIIFAPSPAALNARKLSDEKARTVDAAAAALKAGSIERIPHPKVAIGNGVGGGKDLAKQVCFDPHMQSLNSRKFAKVGEPGEESLDTFFYPANEHVPEDYPVKPLGECPYSKAQQHDLPVATLPMCMADKDNYNMRLNLEEAQTQAPTPANMHINMNMQ